MRQKLKRIARSLAAALLVATLTLVSAPALAQEAPIALQHAANQQTAANASPSAPQTSQQDASAQNFSAQNYILGVGDRLRVIVFGEQSLSGEFVVDSTGRVALPLIGEVQAAGSSLRQFEDAVEHALRDGYLNDPRVSAEVLNFRPFYILGEVQHPGQYPYTNNLTVLNAVATAGGFTPLANQMRFYVKHSGQEEEQEVSLSGDTTVQPGDTIRIAKGAFYILGEVNRPGEYAFTEGLTALNAIATAGGFTYRANHGRVFIQHQGGRDEHSYRLRPDLLIQPGDTIRIGERFF